MKDARFWRTQHLWSVMGGCRSGMACYDRFLSGAQPISRTTEILAAAEGRDAWSDMAAKRQALHERFLEAKAEVERLNPKSHHRYPLGE